jgi:hypothetical protein
VTGGSPWPSRTIRSNRNPEEKSVIFRSTTRRGFLNRFLAGLSFSAFPFNASKHQTVQAAVPVDTRAPGLQTKASGQITNRAVRPYPGGDADIWVPVIKCWWNYNKTLDCNMWCFRHQLWLSRQTHFQNRELTGGVVSKSANMSFFDATKSSLDEKISLNVRDLLVNRAWWSGVLTSRPNFSAL